MSAYSQTLAAFLFFPSGLFMLLSGLAYEWVDRKLVARFQNRIGPRWFQPLADMVKLLSKEEVVPKGVDRLLFIGLPIVALAGALTAALYVPLLGLAPAFSFPGDLIVTLYLLSLLTLCIGLAGANTARPLLADRRHPHPDPGLLLRSAVPDGAARPGDRSPGAGRSARSTPMPTSTGCCFTQPVGFMVALIGLMGKLELPPFDAPEAETEIVAGALTEYSGRGLALFRLGKGVELVVGLTLVAAFFLGGLHNPLEFADQNPGCCCS